MEAIIIVIIILFGYYSIRKYTKNIGKGCCGSGDTLIRERIIIDNKTYPIQKTYKVEGMTCENCAAILERRLNKSSYKGIIDFKNHTLTVYSKETINLQEIQEIVENAGYSLITLFSK